MMLDQDVVAVSPTSVYRVLKGAGLLDRNRWAPSKKGKGFVQPLKAHEHWHIDISYLNVAGTFYFLCSVLDGYSRAIVHWEIRETMKEPEVETIVQRPWRNIPATSPGSSPTTGPSSSPRTSSSSSAWRESRMFARAPTFRRATASSNAGTKR
jgi:transposase InsO family protein